MPKQSMAGGIPIQCEFDEIVSVDSLIPSPRNPNTHPPAQIDLLAKIIDFQGWRRPIVVSNRSGFIIRGHGALLAAQKAGWSEVPVDYQDYESEAQEWADLIADNRIAELSERNRPELKDLLEELDLGVLDMEITGFTDDALKELMSEFHVPESERLIEAIAVEAELVQAQDVEEQTIERCTEAIHELARCAPARLAKAQAIIIPKSGKYPMILLDDSCQDAVTELGRYEAAGCESPLAALLAARYPLAANPAHTE